jgi:hypothetical protein
MIIQHFSMSLLYDFVDITTFKQLSLKFFSVITKILFKREYEKLFITLDIYSPFFTRSIMLK